MILFEIVETPRRIGASLNEWRGICDKFNKRRARDAKHRVSTAKNKILYCAREPAGTKNLHGYLKKTFFDMNWLSIT